MTANPHAKDAEACGRYVLWLLREQRKIRRWMPMSDAEFDAWLFGIARWAFHWAARAEEPSRHDMLFGKGPIQSSTIHRYQWTER